MWRFFLSFFLSFFSPGGRVCVSEQEKAMEVVTGGVDYVVGCRLAIKTTLGEDIEGTVIAYDNSSKIVVIHILFCPFKEFHGIVGFRFTSVLLLC